MSAAAWPPVAAEAVPVSIWILALQIAGGYLAANFLLVFVALLFFISDAELFTSTSGMIAIGLLLSAGVAVPLMRAKGMVMRQFLFTIALTGHGALIFSTFLWDAHSDDPLMLALPFIALALYEAALLAWVRWMPHQLAAALIGCGALATALTDPALRLREMEFYADLWIGPYWLVACLLWLLEPRWMLHRRADVIRALAYALVLLCLGYTPFLSTLHEIYADGRLPQVFLWLVAAANVIALLLLARPLPRDARHLAAVALLLVALVSTWNAPLVGMGGVALALGFARGRHWLMWLGGAALVYGISRFYYDLQLSLLYKSGLMVLGGALLLLVRGLLARKGAA